MFDELLFGGGWYREACSSQLWFGLQPQPNNELAAKNQTTEDNPTPPLPKVLLSVRKVPLRVLLFLCFCFVQEMTCLIRLPYPSLLLSILHWKGVPRPCRLSLSLSFIGEDAEKGRGMSWQGQHCLRPHTTAISPLSHLNRAKQWHHDKEGRKGVENLISVVGIAVREVRKILYKIMSNAASFCHAHISFHDISSSSFSSLLFPCCPFRQFCPTTQTNPSLFSCWILLSLRE